MSDTSSAVRVAGGLLTADLLSRLAAGTDVSGLEPDTYHLAAGEKLRQAASRKWEELSPVWKKFRAEVDEGDGAPTASRTRDRWLVKLLKALDFDQLESLPAPGLAVDDKTFPLSHRWAHVPIHLLGWGDDLSSRGKGLRGKTVSAPQAMLQELLNRSDDHLWAILSNGRRLRLLRDSTALVGSAYVEFDLEAIFDGDLFSNFALLYALAHRSRFEHLDSPASPASCWLERWRTDAIDHGARALEQLRGNVATAIATLGTGFLQHPDNTQLRKQLAEGDLAVEDFQRTLLRCVYRLLFWFVAEDRGGLHPANANETARHRYTGYFSSARLRDTARRRRGNRQTDLWQTARIVLDALGHEDGRPELALPGIGGIFEPGPLDEPIADAALSNRVLLDVVRTLTVVRDGDVLRPVDFRNLGAEELGSVYELLLELHPRHDPEQATLTLDPVGGSERKTSGSYYTPTSLVECLLDSALNPLLDKALAADDPEAALLDITICDPACGSGHFLVAAARRLGKQVAAVRTDEAEPTPESVRSALRDVIGRCIYGVDINPMAVEIAKIALWLEALEPGKPLSYLDANIRVGNALLGATPALLADGLPDAAFKPIEGDDKKFTAALAKRNKAERALSAEQGELFDDTALREATLRVARAASQLLDRGTPNSLADIHVRARRHSELQASPDWVRARDLADAWCAAFVWPKTPDGPPAITHQVLQRMEQDPLTLPAETAGETRRLAAAYRFFHWQLEFPQIFAASESGAEAESSGWRGGFSCVLGNVPWERVKLQEQEFFAARDPEVAAAPNAAARKRIIKALEINDPPLHMAFLAARRRAEGESFLLRKSGRHPLTARGDLNTYAVFAETGWRISGPNGRFGVILPTGIATDDTTKYFFRHIVDSGSLESLLDFRNKGFFPGAAGAQGNRFCLLTLTRAPRNVPMLFSFRNESLQEAHRGDRRVYLTADEIAMLNPNTGTAPLFRSRRDAEITLGIYRRVPVLVKDNDPSGNPWGISFLRMFDMANDSDLFHTREQLESDGWTLDGHAFTRGPDRMLPLYEAKMFHHYEHRFGDYSELALVAGKGVRALPTPSVEMRDNPYYSVLPRYWVASAAVVSRLMGHLDHRWLLCWRDITSGLDERTAIFGLIPMVAVGHTSPLAFIDRPVDVAPLYANLTSLVFDYCVRQKVGGTHLTYMYLNQTPVLAPNAYRRPAPWARSTRLDAWISQRVLELVYTAADMEPFARMLGYTESPFRFSVARRLLLRAELDAAFFHLYGIGRDDVEHVLESFPIVKRKDIAGCGEYSTKKRILEIFDAMASAVKCGYQYETVVDPPPGNGPRH
ncbi:Eco57I restriction-modification methylase domain-containing protein [Nucisporomicrobium flavum]|uniref:Eco57I restriction-modification methylase domain-containing protein n=1 Tax=Nucisporomicrobium flavum TaxID=2785915 RepID=UPI003C2E33E0